MPTNYKQSNVTGELVNWTRAKKVEITNEFEQLPSIKFIEEVVQSFNNQTIKKTPGRIISTNFLNPTDTFPLLNPETNQQIGVFSKLEVYALLYSLYIHLATEADKGNLLD